MRVRNLIAKPSTFNGNPLLKKRWETVYKDGDGCGFVVNNGTNPKTDGSDIKTGFDILANSDIDVNRSEEKSAWITALPDCTLCFMLNVTALVEMTAAIAVSYQSNNYWRTMNSTRQMNASQSETLAGMVQHVAGQRNACRLTAVNSVDSNTDIMRVSDITIVTGEEKTIMDYLGVGAFSALTAPYALSAGGGVFLLALVILTGGWPHENRESMHRPQGAQEADIVGRRVAHRHQGGGWLANRLRRRRGPITIERQYPGNGCLRTGRWDKHIPSGESFLRRFGFQGGAGLAAMLKSRTVGGGDHGCRLLHRGDGTLLNGLGVAA